MKDKSHKFEDQNNKRHLIVIDPTAFGGGSKVATESILQLLDPQQIRITVLSADKSSWLGNNIKRVHLAEPKWLAQKEQGFGYFIRHAFIALNLLLVRLRLGRFDVALGASGPGVDLALYLLRPLLNFNIIQLIHGPVAKSRTIARCLQAALHVYYLQSSRDSLKTALTTIESAHVELPAHFDLFQNGLSDDKWPMPCQSHTPVIFWAASLLKWKGLDTLLAALQTIPNKQRAQTNICYIRPQGVQLPTSTAPIAIEQVNWFESPADIDTIRANANIFVSTSKKEPFGLSILEAMAAGQCVLIPADGAYWDQILENNINCLKYRPDDPVDLKNKIIMASSDLTLIHRLGTQAANVALSYRASKKYANIVVSISRSADVVINKANLAGTQQ